MSDDWSSGWKWVGRGESISSGLKQEGDAVLTTLSDSPILRFSFTRFKLHPALFNVQESSQLYLRTFSPQS